jgi:hypothetical protein
LATVTIPFSRGSSRIHLPKLCAVCGDRDCQQVSVTFSARFAEGMVGPFVFGRTGTRVLRTTIPVCPRHSRYFATQKMIGCGVALLFLAAIVTFGLGLVGLSMAGTAWGLVAAGVLMALAFGSLIVLLLHGAGMVKARSITERELTLTNVHPKFARAVEDGDGGRQGREADGGGDAASAAGAVGWVLFGGIATVILLIVVCGGLAYVTYSRHRAPAVAQQQGGGNNGPGQDKQEQQRQPKGDPLPIDENWNEAAMQAAYLSDLQEYDAQALYPFGKNGMHGFSQSGDQVSPRLKIVFGKAESPKALSMHAPERGPARVKYRLDGQYRLFRGAVGLADMPGNNDPKAYDTPVVFSVLGDGRLLWQSQTIRHRGVREAFRLSVAGVRELELRAEHHRSNVYCWAVWLDPYLLR